MPEEKPRRAADRLKEDPRVIQAKKLLMEAFADHQKCLLTIRPSQKEFLQTYQEMLENFHVLRGGKLYFPYLGSGWGHGPLVELLDGSIKYDMISGIGPHFWGHSYPPLIEVAIDAALSDTVMQGHLQQNQDAFLLSQLLVKASGLDHCFLSSSGAMANENALKLVFQKRSPATRLLAFDQCFMGRTLALAQITDKPAYREGLPTTLAVDYVPFFHPEDERGSIKHSLHVLRHHLTRYPHQHAAMCFELVQGEAGFHMGTTEFFRSIMTMLKEHEIPIFVDEIQTFGRTLELFAFQYYHLEEFIDVVSIGKLSQICATLFKAHMKPKPGLLSQTFTGSTSALQASCWIVKQFLTGDFFGPKGKLVALHQRFEHHFRRIEEKWPGSVHGPYGIGAMVIFTPHDGEMQWVAEFVQELFHAGVISFVAGSHPTRVRFLIPAGVMTLEDVDSVMSIVEKTLVGKLQR